MKKKKLIAHFYVFTANMIYGINYSLAKDLMPEYIKPYAFILARVLGATFLFWFFHLIFFNEKIKKEDIPRILFCSLFGVAINQLLFFKGLNITTPVNASIIMISNPVMVLILAYFFLKESITKYKLTGIFLAATGTLILLLLKDDFSFGSKTFTGDFMVLVNSISYAIYLIIVKKLMIKYKAITIIKWIFTFGLFMVFPLGINEFMQVRWEIFTLTQYFEFFFVVIATTFFAYLLNISALKQLSASSVSIYIYLQPVFATIISLILLQDKLNWIKIISALLIFSGIYLVSKNFNDKKLIKI